MIYSLPSYILYLLAIAASAVVSAYAVRKIIFITATRKIFDIPDNTRKIHGAEIPSLGGIGVFTGYIVVAAFFMYTDNAGWNYVLISSVILFFTGIYDDLMNMRPLKKLLAQLAASAITVYFTIMPLYHHLAPVMGQYWAVAGLLTVGCTFFINAFNFIDGIDGLACVLAILYAAFLGLLFALCGQQGTAAIIFSLMGAALGLLYYNKAPAKIYMGDTGSMVIGFNIFIFSMLYTRVQPPATSSLFIHYPVGIALSVLFLPVYDAVRVALLRILKGRSPLRADRSHIHYYLLDAGFSHSRSVLIIAGVNVLIIGIAFMLRYMHPLVAVLADAIVASAVLIIIYRLRKNKLS